MVAVIALSINALVGWASVSNADTTPVTVLAGISFHDEPGPVVSLSAGENGAAGATCPAGYTVFGGGYHISGSYVIAPPSVLTSLPSGQATWSIHVVDPKTGGPIAIEAVAICGMAKHQSVVGA
jgi:hypothetical protein